MQPLTGRRPSSLVAGSCLLFVVASNVLFAAERQHTTYPPSITLEELRSRINACSSEHPRLLTTKDELNQLPESLERDPLRQQIAEVVVRQAELLQDVEPVERVLKGRRLLGVSRRCLHRVITLATAYYLTGDVQHVQRCQEEMLAAARFSDWHPDHFLDVAEMTFALAIGYDWLYDQLDDASRQEIREAIVHKGVILPFEMQRSWWIRAENNWGQVCHGGLTAGALAVLEDEPDLAARTVHNALENVVVAMSAYAPRGSYPEGPVYWGYGTTYNVLLIDVLEGVFGTDFGLSAAPGFDRTGAYPALACGPSGLYFNYADGDDRRIPDPSRFWFASRYHRFDWLLGERELWRNQVAELLQKQPPTYERFLPLALLWMDEASTPKEIRMPLNWSSGGKVPIAIHRSSWSDPRATYIGLKGGSPSANHGQMDVGSFVLDADGVRWAVDLGAEGYHAIEARGMDLWSRKQDSDRWTIFRQSNFGHNTLVIDDQLQVAAGNAPIVEFSDDPVNPYSIVDLSAVYHGQANTVLRGVALLPSREVIVQDELTGLEPGTHVRWGMITPGNPDDLDGRAITLQQSGERLMLTLLSPPQVTWKQIDTAKPRHDWDSPNPGTRMVAFEAVAPESGELTLAILATPGSCNERAADDRTVAPLSTWRQRDGQHR